jgi:hypothetical protein
VRGPDQPALDGCRLGGRDELLIVRQDAAPVRCELRFMQDKSLLIPRPIKCEARFCSVVGDVQATVLLGLDAERGRLCRWDLDALKELQSWELSFQVDPGSRLALTERDGERSLYLASRAERAVYRMLLSGRGGMGQAELVAGGGGRPPPIGGTQVADPLAVRLEEPTAIALDDAGEMLYVATSEHVVYEIDQRQRSMRAVLGTGVRGRGDGRHGGVGTAITAPTSLAVFSPPAPEPGAQAERFLLVCDAENRRLLAIKPHERQPTRTLLARDEPVPAFGRPTSGPADCGRPAMVRVMGDKTIVVVDDARYCLLTPPAHPERQMSGKYLYGKVT